MREYTMRGCADARMHGCTDARMHGCTDARQQGNKAGRLGTHKGRKAPIAYRLWPGFKPGSLPNRVIRGIA